MSLFAELKRRNVFRVGAAYAVVAWLSIEVSDTVFPRLGLPEWTVTLVIALLLLGFPLALFLAWAYELTPEGIRRSEDIAPTESVTAQTGRTLDRVVIMVLALALAYFAFDKLVLSESREKAIAEAARQAGRSEPAQQSSGEQSIAVLPFVNMSDDPANEYFSDGISEELLNVLVKVSGIKVASRTSSFAFKHKDTSIPEIARQLKVDHVLEGSVRKSGQKIRVTAQLIEVSTDRHLWSESYDRELEDIFVIQDDIARQIVHALSVALGAGEQQAISEAVKLTDNLAAHELYMRGRYLWQRRGETNIRQAIELFEQAIEIDPAFARAWSSLAAANLTLPSYSGVATSGHYPRAGHAAKRALELDPSLAEAYAVLGDIAREEHRWHEAERFYLAGIGREPRNATAHLWYGEFLMTIGRDRDAAREVEFAHELDPLAPGTNVVLADIYLAQGRSAEGEALARVATELGHDYGEVQLGYIYFHRGDYEQAIAAFEAARATVIVDVVRALRDGGEQEALALLRDAPADTPAFALWFGLTLIGATDDIYDLLNTRFEELSGNAWFGLWGPGMAQARQDSRFVELLRRLGLVEYYEASRWPDLCRTQENLLVCR
jgi:TolB-like protein/Tfp pilus assembly protein PilF